MYHSEESWRLAMAWEELCVVSDKLTGWMTMSMSRQDWVRWWRLLGFLFVLVAGVQSSDNSK